MRRRSTLIKSCFFIVSCINFSYALLENRNLSEEFEKQRLDDNSYVDEQLLPVHNHIVSPYNNQLPADFSNIEIISAPIITAEDLQPLNNPIESTTTASYDIQNTKTNSNNLRKKNRIAKKFIDDDTISDELTSFLKPSAKKLRLLSSLLPTDGGNLKELLDLDNIFTAIIKYFEKEPDTKAENIQEKILNGQKKNSFLYDFITSASNLRPIRAPEFKIFESIGEGLSDIFNNPLREPPTLNLNLFGNSKGKHRIFGGNSGLMMASANSLSRHLPAEKPLPKKLKPNPKMKKIIDPRQAKMKKVTETEGKDENTESLTKTVQNLKKVIKVVGELDTYLTSVFKSYIKKLAKVVDEEEKNSLD